MVVMVVLPLGGHVPNIFSFPRRLTYLINLDLTTYDEREFLSFGVLSAVSYTVICFLTQFPLLSGGGVRK